MQFGATTTTAEVLAGVDLTGKRAIVTGGSSGLGLETARALAAAGAAVTIAVRSHEAGVRAVAGLDLPDPITVATLDLSDQASIARFVQTWQGSLHILVNNAGVALTPLTRTPEGWELQFATNHLGHFALATGLRPALAAAGGARVVSVSSGSHLRSPIVFDDIHFERRTYDRWSAYGQSKTANVLFAVAAAQRWSDDGISVNSVMPGVISTNLQRHFVDDELDRLRDDPAITFRSVEQGAATSVLVAASPLASGASGHYFEDCAIAPINERGGRGGVAAHAMDPEAAQRLWEASEAMLGS